MVNDELKVMNQASEVIYSETIFEPNRPFFALLMERKNVQIMFMTRPKIGGFQFSSYPSKFTTIQSVVYSRIVCIV